MSLDLKSVNVFEDIQENILFEAIQGAHILEQISHYPVLPLKLQKNNAIDSHGPAQIRIMYV